MIAEEITREDVERRIIRAWRYDIAMPDAERALLRAKVCWPDYAYDRGDLNAQAENAAYLKDIERDASRMRSWRSKAAADDYLTALGWVQHMARAGLAPRRTRRSKKGRHLSLPQFCRLVAWGDSMKTIGEQDGTDERGACRRWAGIVETCHAIANGWTHALKSGRPAGVEPGGARV